MVVVFNRVVVDNDSRPRLLTDAFDRDSLPTDQLAHQVRRDIELIHHVRRCPRTQSRRQLLQRRDGNGLTALSAVTGPLRARKPQSDVSSTVDQWERNQPTAKTSTVPQSGSRWIPNCRDCPETRPI